jgi:four helix bundle protein
MGSNSIDQRNDFPNKLKSERLKLKTEEVWIYSRKRLTTSPYGSSNWPNICITIRRNSFCPEKYLISGTNITLLVEEGKQGEDRADFIQKYSVANKEAFKSNLILRLLHDSGFLNDAESESILGDCGELQGILITSLRTGRKNL